MESDTLDVTIDDKPFTVKEPTLGLQIWMEEHPREDGKSVRWSMEFIAQITGADKGVLRKLRSVDFTAIVKQVFDWYTAIGFFPKDADAPEKKPEAAGA